MYGILTSVTDITHRFLAFPKPELPITAKGLRSLAEMGCLPATPLRLPPRKAYASELEQMQLVETDQSIRFRNANQQVRTERLSMKHPSVTERLVLN